MRVVESKMKGFVALDAHPAGCRANVERAIVDAERSVEPRGAPGAVLVLGASTGYGLASTLTAVFGHRLSTVGVCLERAPERGRTATAGWYNAATALVMAREQGLDLRFVSADGFSHETKARVVELLREQVGEVGILINSVAAPVRVDPDTGERFRSSLKPIGAPYRTKTIRLDSGQVSEVELEAASVEEIDHTRRVMGGDDWALWVDALADADLLTDEFRTIAFSYVGPELTFPINRSGTIGQAKQAPMGHRRINQPRNGRELRSV